MKVAHSFYKGLSCMLGQVKFIRNIIFKSKFMKLSLVYIYLIPYLFGHRSAVLAEKILLFGFKGSFKNYNSYL